MTATGGTGRDKWAAWLLEHRFGGDPEAHDAMLAYLAPVRDEVLRRAAVGSGETVLDVGCGDGLIGFGALELVGAGGRVIFSDVSADLLDVCRELAAEAGATDRCEFVRSSLPSLAGIPDESADVLTTRSVLIYVTDLAAAFAAMRRVLRPGGRISLFEPINRFGRPEPAGELWGFDVRGLEPVAAKLAAAWERFFPAQATLLGFDERDMIAAAEAAGLRQIRLRYDAEIVSAPTHETWDRLIKVAPNPLVPPLGEVLDRVLTPDELAALRERVEAELAAGRRLHRLAVAYLSAARD